MVAVSATAPDMAQVTVQVMLYKESLRERPSILAQDQDIPRQHDHGEQTKTENRSKPVGSRTGLSANDQKQTDNQPGEQQADRALGENGERHGKISNKEETAWRLVCDPIDIEKTEEYPGHAKDERHISHRCSPQNNGPDVRRKGQSGDTGALSAKQLPSE